MFGIILGAWTIKHAGVSRINWLYKKPQLEARSEKNDQSYITATL
jgi:hypothetical protein